MNEETGVAAVIRSTHADGYDGRADAHGAAAAAGAA
jgi:hypothetical protein